MAMYLVITDTRSLRASFFGAVRHRRCGRTPRVGTIDQALRKISILGDTDLLHVHTPKGQLEAAAFKLLHRQPSKPFFRYIHKNHVSLSSILLYHCVTT